MRRFLQHNKWVTASMVVLFLFASSGMTVSRMTCLLGGHSELSMGMAADCNTDSDVSDGPTITATCCAFSIARADLHDFLVHPPTVLPPAEWLTEQVFIVSVPARIGAISSWLDTRPPPISGPERLVAFSIQRV